MPTYTESDKITLAINTHDTSILFSLMRDVSSRVRRAVARNKFASKEIINSLVNDPVLNVSYMASLHNNCTSFKIFSDDTKHPCVKCKVQEDIFECGNCKKPSKFRSV